jgi:hypothetical protein
MTVNRQSDLAAELWAQLGYEGCRDLREALRHCMADHRAAIAEERRAAGLTRPRATRKPTIAARAAEAAGGSEASVNRARAVEQWVPHLVPEVMAGTLTVWAAYQEAVKARDSATLRALAMAAA